MREEPKGKGDTRPVKRKLFYEMSTEEKVQHLAKELERTQRCLESLIDIGTNLSRYSRQGDVIVIPMSAEPYSLSFKRGNFDEGEKEC